MSSSLDVRSKEALLKSVGKIRTLKARIGELEKQLEEELEKEREALSPGGGLQPSLQASTTKLSEAAVRRRKLLLKDCLKYYSLAGRVRHAIRLADIHALESDIVSLALGSDKPEDLVFAAGHFWFLCHVNRFFACQPQQCVCVSREK